MNERILELLDEACEYAHSKHFAHVKKFKYVTPERHANAQDTMQEKFAELIVKECAMIVEGFTFEWEVAEDQYQEYEASDVLKKHFGVE
jgi:hypothetical protein